MQSGIALNDKSDDSLKKLNSQLKNSIKSYFLDKNMNDIYEIQENVISIFSYIEK